MTPPLISCISREPLYLPVSLNPTSDLPLFELPFILDGLDLPLDRSLDVAKPPTSVHSYDLRTPRRFSPERPTSRVANGYSSAASKSLRERRLTTPPRTPIAAKRRPSKDRTASNRRKTRAVSLRAGVFRPKTHHILRKTPYARGAHEMAQFLIDGRQVDELLWWFRGSDSFLTAPKPALMLKLARDVVYETTKGFRLQGWADFLEGKCVTRTNVRLLCAWFLFFRPDIASSEFGPYIANLVSRTQRLQRYFQ